MITIERKNNESPTGWAAYVAAFKEKYKGSIIDYKVLMQQYIRGIPV